MQEIKISLNSTGKASSPLLIHVNEINFKSYSKAQCIVYYQIPLSFKYQSIQKLNDKDLFLPDCRLSYKIVNFINKTQQIVQDNSQLVIIENKILLTNKSKNGTIQIKGVIINKAKQSNVFADISLKRIQGYEKFYQYRKKYKTLQNITRKIQFSLDHRIKLICQKTNSKQQFFFSMDQLKDKQIKNWYIQLTKNTKITIFFQQIVSIGDTNFQKTIEEGSFYFDNIQWDNSYDIVLQMSQYLKITFSLKMIKNKNLSKFQFVSLRVFQISQKDQILRVGSQQTINSLSGCIELNPLLQGKYYDLQYGYLNQNLKQLQGIGQQQKLHTYLERLTSSKQKYQHFINQKVLDLSNCKNLMFMVNENIVQIPVTYLLQGYNSFGNQNFQVKFLLQVQENFDQQQQTELQSMYKQFRAIPRKLIQVKVQDLLNIGQIPLIMQQNLFSTDKQFFLKIKCQSTIYTAQFQISIVKKSEFKNQAKQLQLKTQFSKFIDGSFLLLKQTQNKQNLLLIKSKNLQQFYILQLTDTTPVSFDISTKKHVIMHGQILKSQFYNSNSQYKKKIILSPNGVGNNSQKSVICLKFKEILQQIDGPSFNFKIKYRISTAKTQSFQPVFYDLSVLRIKQQDSKSKRKNMNKNKLSDKIQLQIQNDNISNTIMKQFSSNRSCFVQKTSNILLEIKLKKMHYDVDLNVFDNDSLIQKSMLLNRGSKDKINQQILTSELPTNYFREYEFDAYDQAIKQKVTLHIQIYCSKQPFSIGDQHVYHFKIPTKLWKMNSLVSQNEQNPKIQVESYLSSKRNKQNKKCDLVYNSGQQVLLGHFNYSDGISVKVIHENGLQLIGYNKIRQCIKGKCNVLKDQFRWMNDGQWYFGVLNMQKSNFYFLIKMQFNPNAQRQSSNQSRATQKTKSKQKKETSNQKGGPDLFAKTLKNFEGITKLKFLKNNLQDQFKKLTSKYVQRQQTIVKLKKKNAELQQENRRKKQEMDTALDINKKGQKSKVKKNIDNKPSIYRSLCQCGQQNPQFMGYCQKCLQKLRQKYEIFFKQYQQMSSEYQKGMFQKFNLRDKIQKLKSKINSYKSMINGDEGASSQIQLPNAMQRQFDKMEQKKLTLQIQELKLQIFDIQRQRESQFERRSYQMNELQKKIKKQDDQLWDKSQQLNRLNMQLNQIKQQISQNNKKMDN